MSAVVAARAIRRHYMLIWEYVKRLVSERSSNREVPGSNSTVNTLIRFVNAIGIVKLFVRSGVGDGTDMDFLRARLHAATANAVVSETPSHSRHRRRITVRKF